MRSVLTALAFLAMLLAVMPAVKRSLYPGQRPHETGQGKATDDG